MVEIYKGNGDAQGAAAALMEIATIAASNGKNTLELEIVSEALAAEPAYRPAQERMNALQPGSAPAADESSAVSAAVEMPPVDDAVVEEPADEAVIELDEQSIVAEDPAIAAEASVDDMAFELPAEVHDVVEVSEELELDAADVVDDAPAMQPPPAAAPAESVFELEDIEDEMLRPAGLSEEAAEQSQINFKADAAEEVGGELDMNASIAFDLNDSGVADVASVESAEAVDLSGGLELESPADVGMEIDMGEADDEADDGIDLSAEFAVESAPSADLPDATAFESKPELEPPAMEVPVSEPVLEADSFVEPAAPVAEVSAVNNVSSAHVIDANDPFSAELERGDVF